MFSHTRNWCLEIFQIWIGIFFHNTSNLRLKHVIKYSCLPRGTKVKIGDEIIHCVSAMDLVIFTAPIYMKQSRWNYTVLTKPKKKKEEEEEEEEDWNLILLVSVIVFHQGSSRWCIFLPSIVRFWYFHHCFFSPWFACWEFIYVEYSNNVESSKQKQTNKNESKTK